MKTRVMKTRVTVMNFDNFIFNAGNKAIDRMNSISLEIDSTNTGRMVNVINSMKRSLDRYREYSDIGFFGRMFKNDLEIKANLTISIINLDIALNDGTSVLKSLHHQYEVLNSFRDSIDMIFNELEEDIQHIDSIVNDLELDGSTKARLLRKRDDLLSAQILSKNNALQFELAKNNISILIEKFNSIEKILAPAIRQSMQLKKSEFTLLVNTMMK